MRAFSRLILLLITTLLLIGCGPQYKKDYSYAPPTGSIGKLCISQCLTAKSHCQRLCTLREQNCRTAAKKDADEAYREYKYEERYAGKRPKSRRSEFDRDYMCRSTCQCKPAFNTCYRACGGTVYEKKVAIN